MLARSKRGLWRGLTALLVFVLCISMTLGGILEANAGSIDTALGTLSSGFVSEQDANNPLYDKFTPPQEYLNADGSGNSNALIAAAIDLNRREVAEGSVLLKNENNVLPLSSGANVTLFGIRSHSNLLGSSFGVKAQGAYISLEQALSQNKTDFANTMSWSVGSRGAPPGPTVGTAWTGDEFDFEGAGYNLNQTMIDIYDKLGETYPHYENEPAAEVYDPGEPSVDEIAGVNSDYKSSFAQYGDAAIVVIVRPSCEQLDYLPGGVADGLDFEHGEPFSLTKNERDMIELAKECSDKVVVLVQSSASVEIGSLKDDPDVDAILWIGAPGCYGFLGVADILCGRVSPSGGLFDIFTAYNMSAPAMQNMGKMYYSNTEGTITRTGGVLGFTPGAYAIEAEGIYVGYRYYETRYYDCVAGTGGADSAAGAYGSSGGWNYDDEVTYGFGYGMSYTTFDMSIEGEPKFDIGANDNGSPSAFATFSVKVTNTGSAAGKTPVQIYGQAPYTPGGVEKPAIQLLNFEKTDVLAPGESATVDVKVDLQFIASYDESYDNGDGTKGTYIMDPGDYYFAVGNGAHDALNAIMAAQGMDASKMSGKGNAAQAYKRNITESFISKTMFSVSKTGYKISNQLPYADWNFFQPGEVTYLTRSDWAGTYPKSYDSMTLTSQELIDYLNGKIYELKTNDDTSGIKWGVDNGIKIYEMYGVPYHAPIIFPKRRKLVFPHKIRYTLPTNREGVFNRLDWALALMPHILGLQLNFCNQGFHQLTLVLGGHQVEHLTKGSQHFENSIKGQDVLGYGLLLLLGSVKLPLDAVNVLVQLIQAGVHVLALPRGGPVIVGDVVDVPLQVALAGFQFFELLFVPSDFHVDVRAAGLLSNLGLHIRRELRIIYQTPSVLDNLSLYPLGRNGVLLAVAPFGFDMMAALVIHRLPLGAVLVLPPDDIRVHGSAAHGAAEDASQ